MEKIILTDEMNELDKRFILKQSANNPKCWMVVDKPNNIIYSFTEHDYFNTVKTKYLDEKQENLSYDQKMDLKYEMEYWFLYVHQKLAYPDQEYTFTPIADKTKGYYKISHTTPPLFDVIVKSEGITQELAIYLEELAKICKEKKLAII